MLRWTAGMAVQWIEDDELRTSLCGRLVQAVKEFQPHAVLGHSLGSLIGGFVCDRMNRMSAYSLCGLLSGMAALGLAAGPRIPATYGLGYGAYALCTGFGFAVFTALVLDVLGKDRRAAATGYSVLICSGNLPTAYMTWVDGQGYRYGGVAGLTGADAISNLVSAFLLYQFAGVIRRRWNSDSARS